MKKGVSNICVFVILFGGRERVGEREREKGREGKRERKREGDVAHVIQRHIFAFSRESTMRTVEGLPLI